MERGLKAQIAAFLRNQNRKSRWYKVVSCMAAVVVFCTTYALILPAITMDNQTICGMEEHTHTDDCYIAELVYPQSAMDCSVEANIHTHDDDCYDSDGNLICGYADFVVHEHDKNCYSEDGSLICTLPEMEEHTHTAECYSEERALICGMEEDLGHTHTSSCYKRVLGEVICGQEECEDHHHTDDCYEWIEELVCTEGERAPGHIHDSGCYKTERVLLCDKTEVKLHTHGESCYGEDGTLICGKLQVQAHQHTAECIQAPPADAEPEEQRTLVCGKREHTHSEECYPTSSRDSSDEEIETKEDWEELADLVVLTGDYRQDVLSIAESQAGYTENSGKIAEEEPQTQRYRKYGDGNGDESAMFVAFCLHYAEVEDMPLASGYSDWIEKLSDSDRYNPADGEYVPLPGDLIFFRSDASEGPDHVGIVAELIPETEEDPARADVIENNSDDAVRHVIYDLTDEQICGYGLLPEQEFYCGKTGHVHTEACEKDGEAVCGMEEHIHTEECFAAPEQMLENEELLELCYTGSDYKVQVFYGADADLPEGVTLAAEEIPAGSEAYQNYYQQTLDTLTAQQQEGAEQVLFARFFDVQFLLDGEVVEPAGPVSVIITYDEAVETGGDVNCQAIHFAEDGPELLAAETESSEEGTTSFTHTQESFSVLGSVVSRTVANETDVGPDGLPVDYFVCIDGTWTCVGSTKMGWYAPADATGWSDSDRDYISVEQIHSILDVYGFTGEEEAPNRKIAYQFKTSQNIYSDTGVREIHGQKFIPLSRNVSHPGYKVYYLPGNSNDINGISLDALDKTSNGFYTVKVYDEQGELLTSKIVKTGGSFSYDAGVAPANGWLVAYGSGSTNIITGSSTITLDNITSTVTISPGRGTTTTHSVTFKVMIDGEWQSVGSLPYYYTGEFNGSSRAYITSDMAAQFFGDFGYTATTAPGYQFGYSYDDIYTLFYANGTTKTSYCMDVAGGTIQEAQTVQLYKNNGTDAQVFRIWDAVGGYSFITPINNSSFHVNVYGYTDGDPSSTQLKLSEATNENSQWRVDTGSDGRTTFWSAIAPYDQVIDLLNGNMSNEATLQIWHSTGGARYWYLDQLYRISNDTASAQNDDGTYNIGLTAESNGDIVCYYMPAETGSKYTNAAESDISNDNSCWSVTVRDDNHAVYSEGELSGMVQYVAPNGEATVTVRNADGILWGCRGVNGEKIAVEHTTTAGETTFTITKITQPIEVVAGRIDPSYTVQFYAWMDVAADSGTEALQVIDTSGGNRPGNYTSWFKRTEQPAPSPASLKQIYLNADGTLATTSKLMEVYSAQDYEYVKAPDLAYVNKLEENTNYTLKAIWVLRPGCDPASTDESDWTVYGTDASFVNSTPENANEIMVTDDTVIRLVYDESSGSYTNGANFYDYDITDGSRVKKTDTQHNNMTYWVTQTRQYGINSNENYSGSGTKLAFGNRNTGMSLQDQLWGTNYLNHLNASLPAKDPGFGLNMDEFRGFQGCTFGLVTGLKSDGTIQYASGVDAPKLFNESGTVTGKTSFDNGEFNLQFNRVGDTYTLTAVNTSDGKTAAGTLEKFDDELGSNNFWPMDSASTWGAEGHDLKFGNSSSQYARRYNSGGYYDSLPVSDDGKDHNSYFGMQYAVNFNLTENYVGPLEYYFYGDDDMWVFLDNQLVCDIGGVHSTVGEYVNLWDYIDKGDAGTHTLTFFYTERGASGSTCYMRFTLPSVSNATLSKQHGDLAISKTVSAEGFEDFSYQFQVDLLTKEGGSAIKQTCRYIVTDESGTVSYGIVRSGGTISLKAGQTATISGIPAGTYYQVTEAETSRSGYQTTVNGNTGYIIAGEIANGEIQTADFVNTPYYELPSTGGTGTAWYTLGGLGLMAGALLLYIALNRRKGGRDSPC